MKEYKNFCAYCDREVSDITCSGGTAFEWNCPNCGIVYNIVSYQKLGIDNIKVYNEKFFEFI